MDDILKQLYDIYLNFEWWDTPKKPRYNIDFYHKTMIDKGNLFYEVVDGKIVGYCLALKLNYEQLGRMICKENINHMKEDLLSGNVAYVFGLWVDQENKESDTMLKLKKKYFEFTKDCDYFVGEALRKKCQPLKVFNRKHLKELSYA